MREDFQKYLDYHKINGGTGKLFNFEIIEYRIGYLKLKGSFNAETLNPNGTVQSQGKGS